MNNCSDDHRVQLAEVRANKTWLQLQFDCMPVACVAANPEFCVTAWNRAAERLFGYAAAEMLGQDLRLIAPPEVVPQLDSLWHAESEGQNVLHSANESRTKDGRVMLCEWTNTPLRDDDGGIIGILSTVQDITERQRTEAALVQERLLLRTLIDNIPDCIYAKDIAGRKILANPADLKNLRCQTEAEAIGKTDFDVFPPEIAAKFFADDQSVIKTGQPVLQREEYFFDEAGGKHWLLTSKVPLRDADGTIVGLVGIGRDISSLKQTEEKLENIHKELLAASRQAGMAEVATGVLHNVGNVLNSVNVSTTLISQRVKHSRIDGVSKLSRLLAEHQADLGRFLTEDERGRQVPVYLGELAEHLQQERQSMAQEITELSRNVDHVKEIVAMQQNYARVLGVVETVALPDLVEDAIKIHAGAYLRHNISVAREYDPLPTAVVDKHKVLQILVNLISNAKYACDAGGQDKKQVTLRIRANGAHRAQIQVADNGIGIVAENLTRVFSQGFTTRRGGHGFGLHSGALAAAELGGSLTAQSAGTGQGATFILELPLAPPTAAPSPANQAGQSGETTYTAFFTRT